VAAHDVDRVPGATPRADVAVLGGGLAGLSAALAFARSGRRVVLLERDGPIGNGGADELFNDWKRPGIAHFRQPHNFLGLARRVLLDEAPDVLDAALGLGASENRQYELLPGDSESQDESFVSIFARRPVFEIGLRRAVEDEANVSVVTDTRVVGLVAADASRGSAVRITGARTSGGEEIEADLFVDALGRTSPLVSWLASLGARPPLERRAECGLIYYSRHFRFRPDVEMPTVPSLHRVPRGEIGYMAFGMFVQDNRTFALVLMIPPWERDLRVLRFERAYMATALSMPSLVPWVHPDQSDAISPVLPMGSLQNVHRSLIVDGEPVAVGIQPIGDALCHTNPTFAYGASLSINHAFTLARIAVRTDDAPRIARAFDAAVGADAAARFDSVSAEDRDRLRLWQGEPIDVRDPSDSMALFLRLTAGMAAAKDPDLFRALARRVNLLDPPNAMERDEVLIERARKIASDGVPPSPAGPTRAELLETISDE
jgi:2-polyprenyl-6-methoxyphenol hydroxylase-like FAD-dependent oxidoreductase